MSKVNNLPLNIHCERASASHVQGIAIDTAHKHIYVSFTTSLCKYDLDGNLLGSVIGLTGHLGCLDFNDGDGKVYGSIEYKHDGIGKGIIKALGNASLADEDAFYIAIFDVDKIDRLNMDAEKDGVMTAVHLQDVVDDYHTPGYRYGCSGIDGTTFAPLPGEPGSKKYLYVAYGIYGEPEREGNDHQVILRYDVENWAQYAAPLDQRNMHRQGPDTPDEKYFLFTGNTTWGVQNLEYDPVTGYMLAAVYQGKKPQFPNYPMFAVDMNRPAEVKPLQGLAEEGAVLSLAKTGLLDDTTGLTGYDFPHGSTGMATLNDGCFYFSRHFSNETGHGTNVGVYRFAPETGFEKV